MSMPSIRVMESQSFSSIHSTLLTSCLEDELSVLVVAALLCAVKLFQVDRAFAILGISARLCFTSSESAAVKTVDAERDGEAIAEGVCLTLNSKAQVSAMRLHGHGVRSIILRAP